MKAYLRGMLLKAINVHKKSNVAWENLLATEVQKREAQYIQDPTPSNRSAWKDAQLIYRRTALDKAEHSRFYSKCHGFEKRERTGHMLAVIASSQNGTNSISSITTPGGTCTNEQCDILRSFGTFYSKLYLSKVNYPVAQLREFLDSLKLRSLSLSLL